MGDPLDGAVPGDDEFTGFHDTGSEPWIEAVLAGGVTGDGREFGPGSPEANRALLDQVEACCRQHPAFGAWWRQQVREAADGACADLAGQRMAGVTQGRAAAGPVTVPVPGSLGLSDVQVLQAFGFALLEEVTRRLGVMGGRPGGGPG